MIAQFEPEKSLSFPHLSDQHPLTQLLEVMLTARGAKPNRNSQPRLCWGQERYNLQRSSAFQALSLSKQDDVLLRLTELNLALSYFIEKSGHHYAAKMILTSPSSDEKTFFALMASEEATHLRMFMNSMWFQPSVNSHFHPMLPALDEAIQSGHHDCLLFVIQVLLEGFGIAHYSALRETCIDSQLKGDFQTILTDEAKHHGAGLILCREQQLSPEVSDQIFEFSRKFVRSLESAHWIPNSFEAAGKPLTDKESEQLFFELDFKSTLEARMQRLREMFVKVNYTALLTRLDNEGIFHVSTVST